MPVFFFNLVLSDLLLMVLQNEWHRDRCRQDSLVSCAIWQSCFLPIFRTRYLAYALRALPVYRGKCLLDSPSFAHGNVSSVRTLVAPVLPALPRTFDLIWPLVPLLLQILAICSCSLPLLCGGSWDFPRWLLQVCRGVWRILRQKLHVSLPLP